jgi:hypothetical protein
MKGVEVLNTFIEEGGSLGEGIYAIITGIIAIVAIVITIYLSRECSSGGTALLFSVILLFLSIVGIYQSFFKEDTTYYQIIIDDSVSMVEFNEKYDIVKVEGKIYTIKEKEN